MAGPKSNIVLIGMAGSGKSTIGRLLARQLDRHFLDTDTLIEKNVNKHLQEIIDTESPAGFRRIEEGVILRLNCRNRVIATGGSVVYSQAAMEHLRRIGQIILLKVELSVLTARICNAATRGLVKKPEQSFADLYAERLPLYVRYADYVIDCSGKSKQSVCREIMALSTAGFPSREGISSDNPD